MSQRRSIFQFRRRCPAWSLPIAIWWTIASAIVLTFFWIFHGLRRLHRDRIPATGPLIFVANHQSHYDPLIAGVVTRDRPFTSIARQSLFDPIILGFLLRSVGSVPIERGKGGTASIKTALKILENGGTVFLFPEGTRSVDGQLGDFKQGFILLAKKSGVPVVPIAIEGAFNSFPKGQSFPKLHGKILASVGEPIPTEELMKDGPGPAVERVKRDIETMRLDLRAKLRTHTNGKRPPPGPADEPYWSHEQVVEDDADSTEPACAS